MNITLIIVGIATFILNIPFGYWRSNVRKFSPYWFLAVHLPIPFVVVMRIFSGLGFKFITYPVILGAYFLGQFVGAKINRKDEMQK